MSLHSHSEGGKSGRSNSAAYTDIVKQFQKSFGGHTTILEPKQVSDYAPKLSKGHEQGFKHLRAWY